MDSTHCLNASNNRASNRDEQVVTTIALITGLKTRGGQLKELKHEG